MWSKNSRSTLHYAGGAMRFVHSISDSLNMFLLISGRAINFQKYSLLGSTKVFGYYDTSSVMSYLTMVSALYVFYTPDNIKWCAIFSVEMRTTIQRNMSRPIYVTEWRLIILNTHFNVYATTHILCTYAHKLYMHIVCILSVSESIFMGAETEQCPVSSPCRAQNE